MFFDFVVKLEGLVRIFLSCIEARVKVMKTYLTPIFSSSQVSSNLVMKLFLFVLLGLVALISCEDVESELDTELSDSEGKSSAFLNKF